MNSSSFYKRLFSFLGWYLVSFSVFAGQTTTTINFSATFLAGTCDVSVQPTVINWGGVSSSTIRSALRPGVEPVQLDINYANCNGNGISPKLEIIGATLNGNVPDAGIPLFSNSEGILDGASGYGVRLALLDNPDIALDTGSKIELTEAANGKPLDNLHDRPTIFQASLSCGDCRSPELHGGQLSATVTFRFLYE